MSDPQTDTEWQEAVNLADMHLKIHDAKLYGLIEGGPDIDQARCLEVRDRGQARGVSPNYPESEMGRLLAEYSGTVKEAQDV